MSQKYPNPNWIDDSPWNSIEEFEKELEASWEETKRQGFEKGILTQREDGAIIGRGHPSKLFDAVDAEGK
jgi:hypothetical protein